MHACKTDRALHCFTWMIVKHNEAANFRALPRNERMAVHELMLFVPERCAKKNRGEWIKWTWRKEKKKEMETRTYTNVPTVGHYFLFVYPLIFSLQFFIPFFFFLSLLFSKDGYIEPLSLPHMEKTTWYVCVRTFPWQAVERKSSKQYYLTVKVSPR